MRRYDDLEIGERQASRLMHVDRSDMIAFAKTYDPQWFHADETAAQNSIFGEVTASGIYGLALWRRLDHEICGDIDFICGVAWQNVQWFKALKADMHIRATSELINKRASGSDPSRGIVTFISGIEDDQGDPLIRFENITLVKRA
jgi:acyl dehydratase